MHIRRSYIICSTMRSGSTMLASGLRQTGIAGRPEEYFAPPVQLPQAELFSMDPARYRALVLEHRSQHPAQQELQRVLADGTSANGVFGVKIHYQRPFSDFQNAVEVLQNCFQDRLSSSHNLFVRAFPNLSYIWLRRADRVAQAVSLYRAIRTREFVRVDGSSDVVGSVTEDDFDEVAIHKLADWLQSGDNAWRAFFKRHTIEPLTIDYEDLSRAYVDTVRGVLSFLALDAGSAEIVSTRHRRQSDGLSERWTARYRASIA